MVGSIESNVKWFVLGSIVICVLTLAPNIAAPILFSAAMTWARLCCTFAFISRMSIRSLIGLSSHASCVSIVSHFVLACTMAKVAAIMSIAAGRCLTLR